MTEALKVRYEDKIVVFRVITPSEALTTGELKVQPHRFRTNGRGDDTIPMRLVAQGLKAARQQLLISQDGGQDGEMGHTAILSGSDPSRGPLRVGVMASGSGSNFEALVHQCRAQSASCCEVVQLIVNRPNCGAISRAKLLNIPCLLLDHTSFSSREALDRAVVENFRQRGVEMVVMAGWMRIVSLELIEAFPQRLLNIHPSLLPQFRGMHAIRQALEAGVTESGCTVHTVVQDVDAGPILGQARVPVLADDTEASLSDRIHAAEHQLLPEVVLRHARELLLQPTQG